MKRKQQRRATARIYYGDHRTQPVLYWTVKVRLAKKPVTIDGTLLDAIRGTPGSTIGCHLSNCAHRNTDAFEHPCYFAAFTKTTCLVVEKITRGQPSHAVKYRHGYGDLVEINDKKVNNRFIRRHPELAERQFVLRPPRKMRPLGRDHTSTYAAPYHKRALVPRGALKRAIDAGLVSPGLVTQYSNN